VTVWCARACECVCAGGCASCTKRHSACHEGTIAYSRLILFGPAVNLVRSSVRLCLALPVATPPDPVPPPLPPQGRDAKGQIILSRKALLPQPREHRVHPRPKPAAPHKEHQQPPALDAAAQQQPQQSQQQPQQQQPQAQRPRRKAGAGAGGGENAG
jgi:hypothetical protein